MHVKQTADSDAGRLIRSLQSSKPNLQENDAKQKNGLELI